MRRKSIQTFVLHAAFFLALLGLAPGTREILPRVFQSAGNVLLGSLGGGLSVRFEWADPASRPDSADTRMLGRQAGMLKYRWRVVYNAHRRIFWPSATLVALTLATPMSRRRLALALPLGILLFGAFFMLQLAAFAAVLFGATGPVAVGSPTAWRGLLPVAEAMFNTPITNFAAVFLLWAVLANPAGGIEIESVNALLRRLLEPGAAKSPPAAQGPPAADAAEGADRPEEPSP